MDYKRLLTLFALMRRSKCDTQNQHPTLAIQIFFPSLLQELPSPSPASPYPPFDHSQTRHTTNDVFGNVLANIDLEPMSELNPGYRNTTPTAFNSRAIVWACTFCSDTLSDGSTPEIPNTLICHKCLGRHLFSLNRKMLMRGTVNLTRLLDLKYLSEHCMVRSLYLFVRTYRGTDFCFVQYLSVGTSPVDPILRSSSPPPPYQQWQSVRCFCHETFSCNRWQIFQCTIV